MYAAMRPSHSRTQRWPKSVILAVVGLCILGFLILKPDLNVSTTPQDPELHAWLTSLGLESYARQFTTNQIRYADLHLLQERHLENLGLPLGVQLRVLEAIRSLPGWKPERQSSYPTRNNNNDECGPCVHGLCDDGRCVCDLSWSGKECNTSAIILDEEVAARFHRFTKIFNESFWKSKESVSGRGSSLKQTFHVRELMDYVIQKYSIKSMLDLPCGDLNWIQKTELSGVDYVGADIVEGLIEQNRIKFSNDSRYRFLVMDVVNKVPHKPFDLILCRDAMVHMPFKDIKRALRNFNLSGSKYLLTTVFSAKTENRDIDANLDWRELNLMAPPMSLPPPLELHREKFWGDVDTTRPHWNDKSLGLWKLPVPLPDDV